MKRNACSLLKLFSLIALLSLNNSNAFGIAYYIVNVNPWGYTQNQTCMTNVFGAAGWVQGNYSTPIATVFSPANAFVMIEGGDGNSGLPAYLSANITTIENWVAAGGRLFINAAPNYCCNQTWGFSGTTMTYAGFSPSVTTAVPTNPIFLGPYLPTATSYTGGYFGHAWISGTGLTTILYDIATSQSVLCYKQWGSGVVFFGGCTQPNFWSPNPQGINLWQNIFAYVNTFPLTGITTTVSGSPWCAGANITVNYSSIGLTFTAGNQFKVQLSDATGSFASPTQIGIITSTATSGSIACTIPAAQAGGTAYRIRTVSSTPSFTGANNGTDLTINPQLTPAVTISANPGNNICAGTSVTFSASLTNGGPSPAYQWKVNNINVGTAATYTSASLNNGDFVQCVITSNAPCATPTTASSNIINMTVNPNVTPTINITAAPGNVICTGQSVTFSSAITNGGPNPVYSWKLNGFPVGSGTTYTSATLVNGDQITCTLTGNPPCVINPTQTSNTITMTVNPNVTPTINISANPGNTACAGANVTFTANITNGGPTPAYQWKKNGNPVGTAATYSTAALANGDVITCQLTSNATCANPASVTGSMTMTIVPTVTPTINVSTSPGTTVCAGTSVTFTANTTNAGPTPSYQWYINGNPSGLNTSTFTTTGLNNGDVVTCTLLSSAQCPSPPSVTSSGVTMTVIPTVVPTVSISANPGISICSGTNVIFSAGITNGGPTPQYVWYLNGNPVSTSSTYSNNSLVNGDYLTCELTSNATCATPAVVTSSTVTISVTNTLTPGVSISNNTGNTICAGTSVTFSASPLNGGPTPSYQWYRNGNPTGYNSATYIDNTLSNGDVITCNMTSSASCANPTLASSNSVSMTVIPTVLPTAVVSASPGNNICSGTTVNFNAAITNGGPTPVYQWKKNGNPVGGNIPTYSDANLSNTDVITCMLTSNATCATPTNVYSNAVTMNVTQTVVPTVAVSVSPGNAICAGTSVTFSAAQTNGGPTPAYQWYLNGNPIGPNAAAYTTNTLGANDVVSCNLTSNALCATPPNAASNNITMTVQGVTVPGVSISANTPNSICEGTAVTFTAAAINGGPTPVYHWMKNGMPVGNAGDTYSDNNLYNNDVISCVMVSSDLCPSPLSDTSNSMAMTVDQYVAPVVFLSGTPDICSGNPLTLTALPYNPGPSPSYKWMVNGSQAGTGLTWTGNLLNEGDIIYCVMTSTAPCLTKPADTSDVDTVHWFNSTYLAGNVNSTETNNVMMTNATSIIGFNDCDLITTITPSGANPVNGTLQAGVTLDPVINNYLGQPYLQRHYDVMPINNPGGATAIVKLYAYQSEFDAYDSMLVQTGSTLPPLPSNHIDNSNVRITEFHGSGTTPGNYSGPSELIIPSVSWDATANWWVMTFPVSGFGGFYIHTANYVFPLGISNVNSNEFSLTVYPNPALDKVEVKIHGKRGANSHLTVTDLAGRLLMNNAINNEKVLLDLSGFAPGMYMLRYSDDSRTETIKITKQ